MKNIFKCTLIFTFILCLIINTVYVSAIENVNSSELILIDENTTSIGGDWTFENSTVYANQHENTSFILYQQDFSDFSMTYNITSSKTQQGTSSFIFRYLEDTSHVDYISATIDFDKSVAYFYKQEGISILKLSPEVEIDITEEMQVKVEAIGNYISLYINEIFVCSTGNDYTEDLELYGQSYFNESGFIGFSSNNCDAIISNINYNIIDENTTPLLSVISIKSIEGEEIYDVNFNETQFNYQYFVDTFTDHVEILSQTKNINTQTYVTDVNGDKIDSSIILLTGQNTFYVVSYNDYATVKYKVNIFKRTVNNQYFYEDLRNQYHYSLKDGKLFYNMGLVKVGDTYHQFNLCSLDVDGKEEFITAHSTSEDLVNFTPHGVAYYQNEYGKLIGGTVVYDSNNSSGLFGENEGGFVSLITVCGNGNKVILKYSIDGNVWYDKEDIILELSDTNYTTTASNISVIEHDGKWFMLVYDEYLKIYSSNNLIDWTIESTYKTGLDGDSNTGFTIDAKNPSLFKLNYEDTTKWLLICDSNNYIVGDFSYLEDEKRYEFTPDYNGKFDFGSDLQAMNIYYIDSNDEDYGKVYASGLVDCTSYIDDLTPITNCKSFVGTSSMTVELSLTKNSNDTLILRQKPVEQYKSLYDLNSVFEYKGNILGTLTPNYNATNYLIKASIDASNTSTIGFNLRVGDNEITTLTYYTLTNELSIDRSNSSNITKDISEFSKSTSVVDAYLKEEDVLDFEIYVDNSVIEIFVFDGAYVSTFQIFPDKSSSGIEFFSTGGEADIDLTVTPINTIWGINNENVMYISSSTDPVTQDPNSIFTNIDNVIIFIAVFLGASLFISVMFVVVTNKRNNKDGD